jgi:Holliday junction resolvase-like predicted endonuclease
MGKGITKNGQEPVSGQICLIINGQRARNRRASSQDVGVIVMAFWIVSPKHSRDKSARDWGKWTADSFLTTGLFYPFKRRGAFRDGDRCILKVYGSQRLIGDFRIDGSAQTDKEGDKYYRVADIVEWDYPVDEWTLPVKYREQLARYRRSGYVPLSESDFHELLGIRNFTQNLRLNYRNRLALPVSEKDIENLIDSKNALRKVGLEVLDRQCSFSPGNIIDLLCQDERGDLVVVELKRGSANEVIGQLARYITDVREHRAKATQKVRGLILTLEVDEQLVKAARAVDFDVVLCQLTFG